MLPPPLAPLAAWPQFVTWRIEHRTNSRGELVATKVPYSPIHGYGASTTEPATWGTYAQARELADLMGFDGVGFVFTERDPFWFLDIDKALHAGAWSPLAQELCARLPGAACEVSWSGTGLHLIGSGPAPADHGNKNIPLGLELYTKERFVALTGTNAIGSVTTQLGEPLAAIAGQYFVRAAHAVGNQWTTEPDAGWIGPDDDNELVRRALGSGRDRAANVFGANGDPSFADLYNGNVDALARRWPDAGGYDASSADLSLANHLAFWTGRNCDRIERIMRMSSLAREKWQRESYIQTTILKAVGMVRTLYDETRGRTAATGADTAPPAPPPPPVTADDYEHAGMTPRADGGGLMLAQRQMQFFDGCVYVMALNRVLTPEGNLLDKARFNVLMGGHAFITAIDGKTIISDAWTAYTENQAFKPVIADRTCFRPEHGPGGLVRDGGKVLANAYFPAEPNDLEGDPTPFLAHLKRMLPYGEDCELLLGWMATAVQNPGEKIQWWPVVQGAEGNFKSFLLLIMSHAVGGHYSHMPNMDKMVKGNSNFNGWIERKLFLGLEEVYAANRREFFESFKTTVTNLSVPIEGKGIEETTGDNRANGMITTNHKDGVPVLGLVRRFGAFFCAQQTPEDMVRDGMDAAYVLNLKDWLLGRGAYKHGGHHYGVRIMAGYLRRAEVLDQHNPLNMSRAPETTTTAAARIAGRGKAEQEIVEAIEEERPGFAGGWVSSLKLNDLLERLKISVPQNKRRDLMVSLGYDYHPALAANGGRISNVVPPDNGRPKLYCKIGSIAAQNLHTPAEVARAYSEAQQKAGSDKSAAGVAFNK